MKKMLRMCTLMALLLVPCALMQAASDTITFNNKTGANIFVGQTLSSDPTGEYFILMQSKAAPVDLYASAYTSMFPNVDKKAIQVPDDLKLTSVYVAKKAASDQLMAVNDQKSVEGRQKFHQILAKFKKYVPTSDAKLSWGDKVTFEAGSKFVTIKNSNGKTHKVALTEQK